MLKFMVVTFRLVFVTGILPLAETYKAGIEIKNVKNTGAKHKDIMRVTGQELCGAPVFE